MNIIIHSHAGQEKKDEDVKNKKIKKGMKNDKDTHVK